MGARTAKEAVEETGELLGSFATAALEQAAAAPKPLIVTGLALPPALEIRSPRAGKAVSCSVDNGLTKATED